MILADSHEPPPIIAGLQAIVSDIPEPIWGVDYLHCNPRIGSAGVQRKVWPQDFRQSLDDGRLAMWLRKSKDLAHNLLILEGQMPWWHERSGIARPRLRGTLFSLEQYHRVGICWTATMTDTVEAILQWFAWLDHPHGSLMHRPKLSDPWFDPFSRTRRTWFLEGLPGIGPVLANLIFDECGGLPVTWTGPDPRTIHGIGPKRANMIREFFSKGAEE